MMHTIRTVHLEIGKRNNSVAVIIVFACSIDGLLSVILRLIITKVHSMSSLELSPIPEGDGFDGLE